MQDFGPGVTIELFQEKGPSINNHFLYRLEVMTKKAAHSHMVRTELPVMDFDGTNMIRRCSRSERSALNRYLPKN